MPPQQVCTQDTTGRSSLCGSWVSRWSATTQGHLDRLEKWTDKRLKMFNKGRCQILHHTPEQVWGWPSGKQLDREGCMPFLLDNKLSISKQCSHEPTQGCSAKSEASRFEDGDLPSLLSSCEITAVVSSGSSFGVSSTRQTWVYWRECTESSQICFRDQSIWQSERLRKLGLFNLEQIKFGRVVTNVHKCLTGTKRCTQTRLTGAQWKDELPLNTSEQLFNSWNRFSRRPWNISACSDWPSFQQEGWTPDSSILWLHKCQVPKEGRVCMCTCTDAMTPNARMSGKPTQLMRLLITWTLLEWLKLTKTALESGFPIQANLLRCNSC